VAVLVFLYAPCLAVFWVGVSGFAVAVFAASVVSRGMLTLAGHHRYFSHRSFQATRGFQLLMALAGASCWQEGPLSWAAIHRHHHRSSDGPEDVISPVQHGYAWTQFHLWVGTDHALVGRRIHDFDDYPELLWLERCSWPVPLLFAAVLFGLGALVEGALPALGTSGPQLLVWGFFLANAYIIQIASLVNAVCHRFGSQPFATNDGSRNNAWVALLSVGEGWHNNHHRFPWAASNRIEWWQLDLVYGMLKLFSWLGLVWDLRCPPAQAAARAATRGSGPRPGPPAARAVGR
jgi:stearoyl-CoA desaturase (delta-9 desaturase)